MNIKRRTGMGSFIFKIKTNQSLSDLEAKLNYDFNDDYQFSFDIKI
jgi:hypothetical protein